MGDMSVDVQEGRRVRGCWCKGAGALGLPLGTDPPNSEWILLCFRDALLVHPVSDSRLMVCRFICLPRGGKLRKGMVGKEGGGQRE